MDRQREAIKLQKEGNFLDALSLLEQELLLTQQQYGENSPAFQNLGDKVAELCNQLAMNCLVNEKMSQALDLLKRAQILSAKTPHLKAITYNNIACFYRRQGKLRVAMNYLHKALAIDTSPDIYLNLCAVLSQSGKHDLALEQAMHAVILLQETLMNSSPSQHKEVYALKAPVLAIAYHNLAVELEHMKRLPESLRYYTKAVEFARKHLPDDHTVMTALLEAQISANRQAKTRNTKGRKMPPIRGNYRIVYKEARDTKDGKGSRSPSPFLRGQAGRHARSKSPDFGGRLNSISPMRNNFLEQTAAYTERFRTEEIIHTEADRQVTSEFSNPSTPKLWQPQHKNFKSESQPLRNLRRSQLAELRHSIQTAEDIVHISSTSRPMLEISSGKVLAIQVNQNKTSAVFSTDTLSIEPKRRGSDSEPSAISKKKNYTRDALDIINQFGISIYSQEPSGKVSQLLSDGAGKSVSRKASNPNIGNPALEQRLSLKERIASLKSLNSSSNPSVKTDRSIKLPPLPSEDIDLDSSPGKAPSQISRVSLDNSQTSVKVFTRSIRRSNRNSISSTPSHQEVKESLIGKIGREENVHQDSDKDRESREEENIYNLEDVKRRKGDEEENVEEDEIEKREGVGSMRMNINYDDTKLVRKESVFEIEIGKGNSGVSVSSEEFEPDQFVTEMEMSLDKGKEVIDEQAEQEDIEISHEQAYIDINPEQGDIDITSEQGDIDITSEQGDIEISHEQGDIDINPEQGDIEISHEQGDIDITSEQGDIDINPEQGDIDISPEQSGQENQQLHSVKIEQEAEEQGIPHDEDNHPETNASVHIESTLTQTDEVQPEEAIEYSELITSSPQDPEFIPQEYEAHSKSNISLQGQLDINEEVVVEPNVLTDQHEVSNYEEGMIEPDPVQASHDEAEVILQSFNNEIQVSEMNEGLAVLQEEDENTIPIHDGEVEQDLAQIQHEEERNVSSHQESVVLLDESKVNTSIHDEPVLGDQVNVSNHEGVIEVQPEEAVVIQEAADIEVQQGEAIITEEPAESEVIVQQGEAIITQELAEIKVEQAEVVAIQEPAESEVIVQPEELIITQEPADIEVQQEELIITQEPADIEVQQEEAIITQAPAEFKIQTEEAIITQEPDEAEFELKQESLNPNEIQKIESEIPIPTHSEEDQIQPQIDPIPGNPSSLEVSTSPNLALSPSNLEEDLIHPPLSSPPSSLPHVQEIAFEESSPPQDNPDFPLESVPHPSDLQDPSLLFPSSPKSESSKLVEPKEPIQATFTA